jgi:hypothetical protein
MNVRTRALYNRYCHKINETSPRTPFSSHQSAKPKSKQQHLLEGDKEINGAKRLGRRATNLYSGTVHKESRNQFQISTSVAVSA